MLEGGAWRLADLRKLDLDLKKLIAHSVVKMI